MTAKEFDSLLCHSSVEPVTVIFDGGKYIPQKLLVWFKNGERQYSVELVDCGSRTLVIARLDKIELEERHG